MSAPSLLRAGSRQMRRGARASTVDASDARVGAVLVDEARRLHGCIWSKRSLKKTLYPFISCSVSPICPFTSTDNIEIATSDARRGICVRSGDWIVRDAPHVRTRLGLHAAHLEHCLHHLRQAPLDSASSPTGTDSRKRRAARTKSVPMVRNRMPSQYRQISRTRRSALLEVKDG
ncbi:hypothetical protein B0H19DRAFT_1274885 [Mycena capillaripes]|nr:hypothetical protein B0H19DRAFT_1274885 [Mycena capillaripes]